jgi:hypothetical protein
MRISSDSYSPLLFFEKKTPFIVPYDVLFSLGCDYKSISQLVQE